MSFDRDWTISPGETLRDLIEERGWSVADAAKRCGNMPVESMEKILDASTPINYAVAYFLELGTAVSRTFWLNYERRYRSDLAKGRKEIDV